MTYICFSCECGCGFAIPTLDIPDDDVSCPACGRDWSTTETGECIVDPKIQPRC